MKILNYYNTNEQLRQNITAYSNGKRDFSDTELNEIKLYFLKYKEILESTSFFSGSIKDYKAVSCFAESFYEELHSRMITKYNADIAIIVNLKDKKIIFKKNNTCNIDLCKLAQLLTNGDCDESSTDIAEGKLTETFINLSKKFSQCI